MKEIFQISENVIRPIPTGYVYVRATEREIEQREFRGGFARFNSGRYAESKEFPRGSKIDGQEIFSLRKFDKWLKEHNCI